MISSSLVIETALRTLDIESQAILAMRNSIDHRFVSCVEKIFASTGRVVVSGIGKSALVGQKIAATLNSTGTPALFMHAADAIHGDLGMVRPDDIVLLLSKSGETPEIRFLVPYVRQRGNLLIGMAGRTDSYLARQADLLLHTPIDQEADPNNLAPTASTTAQMAMGDALATALLALRGFSPQDFALVHPGGALGKQLYLRVSDLYPNNEKPWVPLDASLPRIILEMTSKRLGCTAVGPNPQTLHGIITDGDLRRMLEKQPHLPGIQAADIMTPHPKTTAPADMAVKALETMRHYSITQLPVVDGDHYLGIIHLHDLLREGIV